MSSPWAEKKSDPRMGRGTSANKKLWLTCSVRKRRESVREPNVRIADPLAATRVPGPVAGRPGKPTKEKGKTETSAPLSMRKVRPDMSSLMEIAPWPRLMAEIEGEELVVPGANAARRWRFPKMGAKELS